MMVATAWEVHQRLQALAEGGPHGLDKGLAGMAAVVEQRRRLQARALPALLCRSRCPRGPQLACFQFTVALAQHRCVSVHVRPVGPHPGMPAPAQHL